MKSYRNQKQNTLNQILHVMEVLQRCALIGWPTHHGLEGPLHRQDLVPDGELDALDFPFVIHPEEHPHMNTCFSLQVDQSLFGLSIKLAIFPWAT